MSGDKEGGYGEFLKIINRLISRYWQIAKILEAKCNRGLVGTGELGRIIKAADEIIKEDNATVKELKKCAEKGYEVKTLP